MDDKTFEETTRPIIANIVEAHASEDYDRASLNFSEGLKKGIDLKLFTQAVENHLKILGQASSLTYLGTTSKE